MPAETQILTKRGMSFPPPTTQCINQILSRTSRRLLRWTTGAPRLRHCIAGLFGITVRGAKEHWRPPIRGRVAAEYAQRMQIEGLLTRLDLATETMGEATTVA